MAGATALNAEFFANQGVQLATNNSLAVQIRWLMQVLPYTCQSRLGNSCVWLPS